MSDESRVAVRPDNWCWDRVVDERCCERREEKKFAQRRWLAAHVVAQLVVALTAPSRTRILDLKKTGTERPVVISMGAGLPIS